MTADPAREPELARCFVELGDPVGGYVPAFRSPLIGLAVTAPALVVGFVLLPRIALLGATLVIIGIVGVGTSLSAMWTALRSMPYRICPGGIVALPLKKVERCAWGEVAALELIRTTQTMEGWSLSGSGSLSAIVTRQDGRKFVLRWLSPQATDFIQGQVFREMAPRLQAELDRGQPVRFGKLEMRADGLVHGRERILWEEIAKVEFSHRVVVHKRDGTRAYFFDVPNLALFLILAQSRTTTGRFDLAPRQ